MGTIMAASDPKFQSVSERGRKNATWEERERERERKGR
jgi:hypothetical protein